MTAPVTTAIVAVVVVLQIRSSVSLARSGRSRRHYAMTVRAIRPWMLLGAGLNLSVVVLVMTGLAQLMPALWLGWWKLLGGRGNVMLAQTSEHGIGWRITAAAVPLLLLGLTPLLAFEEELMFRGGNENRTLVQRFRRHVTFGMIHSVSAGVPIAAGIALTFSGIYFEAVYLKAVRPLAKQIEAAGKTPSFERLPHPALPARDHYDPAEWDCYKRESHAVRVENRRRLDDYLDNAARRATAAADTKEALRETALAQSAAAHAVSNISVLVVLLATMVFI
jgi:hypothetical protein